MDNRLLGLLMVLTGVVDVVMARRMQQLSSGARMMLYIFGGAFAALGVTMLLGEQRTP